MINYYRSGIEANNKNFFRHSENLYQVQNCSIQKNTSVSAEWIFDTNLPTAMSIYDYNLRSVRDLFLWSIFCRGSVEQGHVTFRSDGPITRYLKTSGFLKT